jgi:AcrR family transcriptional regulator
MDTKKRIIDSAAALFAKQGFHAATLRSITDSAGVNVASVNYHFGSKEALFDEVSERRLSTLFIACREKLKANREAAHKGRVTVEETLRAFIEPILHHQGPGSESSGFVAMFGQAMIDPDAAIDKRHMTPLYSLLFESFREVQPELSRKALSQRLHFAWGAIGHTLCTFRERPLLSERDSQPCDLDTQIQMLITFVAAGMKAHEGCQHGQHCRSCESHQEPLYEEGLKLALTKG